MSHVPLSKVGQFSGFGHWSSILNLYIFHPLNSFGRTVESILFFPVCLVFLSEHSKQEYVDNRNGLQVVSTPNETLKR